MALCTKSRVVAPPAGGVEEGGARERRPADRRNTSENARTRLRASARAEGGLA
ncbi:MAG: hypothetical protein ACK4WH_12285 [Phycisphaerales bacterium]